MFGTKHFSPAFSGLKYDPINEQLVGLIDGVSLCEVIRDNIQHDLIWDQTYTTRDVASHQDQLMFLERVQQILEEL